MTIKITTRTDNDGRIYAVVTSADVTSEYRTSPSGCGLWVWRQSQVEWKQIEGLSQFAARDRAHMARQMRRRAAWLA